MSGLRLDGYRIEGIGQTVPFMISVVVPEPTEVRTLHDAALADGAREVRPPKKGFFGGFTGVHVAADGSIWKPSSALKKDRGTPSATPFPDETVLILGVDQPEAVRDFYVSLGMVTDHDYGKKFVDFTLSSDGLRLGLLTVDALVKDAGISTDDLASVPRLVLEHRAADQAEADDLHRAFVAAGGSDDDGVLTDPAGVCWAIAFAS